MRGISRVGTIVGACMLVGTGAVRAAQDQTAQPSAPAPAVVERPAPRPQTPMEKLREEIRARLDGTAWSLELRPLEGTGKTKQDTVSFTGRTVTSQRMEKLGYAASNYSLNVKEDQTASWETMQTKAGEGVVFWRGELEGETMRGVLSQQPAKGPAENYSFVGKQTGGPKPAEAKAPEAVAAQPVPPPAAPEAVPTAPIAPAMPQPAAAVSAPEPAPAQMAAPRPVPAQPTAPEAPKKKKKGWLW